MEEQIVEAVEEVVEAVQEVVELETVPESAFLQQAVEEIPKEQLVLQEQKQTEAPVSQKKAKSKKSKPQVTGMLIFNFKERVLFDQAVSIRWTAMASLGTINCNPDRPFCLMLAITRDHIRTRANPTM